MSDPDNEAKFWGEVVNIAADDEALTGALGSIVLNLPLAVDTNADYTDFKEYLFNRYGLSSDCHFEATFDLCEERILEKVYGEA